MEVDRRLTKTIMLKKVVQETHNCIRTFTDAVGLINQKVHLLWQSFAANSKDTNLAWNKEINWARLQRIAWQVDLLREIKTVVHRGVPAAGSTLL